MGGVMRITRALNEGFIAHIDIEAFNGVVSDIRILSATTLEDLTELVQFSPAWDQAWSYAERELSMQPLTPRAARQARADLSSLTNDTPYQ